MTTGSVFSCFNYVINPLVNLLILSSNLVWCKASSHQNGKKQTLHQFTKKTKKKTSSVSKTADMPLLPICSKVLQHIIFHTMFTYFIKNNLTSKNTSPFKCGDSCVNRLLAITQEIFFSFDDNYKVWGVLLDISNAFNKKWHKGVYS